MKQSLIVKLFMKKKNAKVQQKPVEKKGLFARIKAFFSK